MEVNFTRRIRGFPALLAEFLPTGCKMHQFYYGEPPQFVHRQATPWEEELASVLATIFTAGHHELDAIVVGLNRSTVRVPGADKWTVESFTATLKKVGW